MSSVDAPVLGVIVPCYNEQAVLPSTARALQNELLKLVELQRISAASRIYFIDDGSEDQTWDLISELADKDPMYAGIKLSRNYGHQHAVYAGLMEAAGDAVISIDADLQDDVSAIGEMIEAFSKGKEIVYGVRDDRQNDTLFKRWSAAAHYLLSEKMGIATVRNHADYRLLSRRAIEYLSQYRETHLYLRGLIPLLGLSSGEVYYRREKRMAGVSKYPLKRMISLSVHGFTSFSIMPLRIISGLGLLVFAISIILGGWALYASIWGPGTVPGWASTVIPIYLLGGLQLLAIGVAGEYIGKTFIESKKRPLYQIQEYCGKTR
jgi:glycosyltransferase involved in cell wall biosynthesis